MTRLRCLRGMSPSGDIQPQRHINRTNWLMAIFINLKASYLRRCIRVPKDIISWGRGGKGRQRGEGHIGHWAAVMGISTWAQIGILERKKSSSLVFTGIRTGIAIREEGILCMWFKCTYLVEVGSLHGWCARTGAAPRAQPRVHLAGKTGSQKQPS